MLPHWTRHLRPTNGYVSSLIYLPYTYGLSYDLYVSYESTSSDLATDIVLQIKAIETLKNSVQPTRVIVGVVGNTGAGKSSVISAVLDEERLLPTNCMRACTASPTEISYNYSSDPNELYHAEVQFLTADDWVKELEALYADLLDGSGEVSRDSSNQDTEAGIAYAKIKAVYPRKTKEQMSQSNPRALANETIVRSVLGTSKKLRATTAASIYNQLQTYVDSKEKNTEKHMEYLSLIHI